MLPTYLTTFPRWLGNQLQRLLSHAKTNQSTQHAFNSSRFNQLAQMPTNQLPEFVQESKIALHYLHWLGRLAWHHFPERSALADDGHKWRGPTPQSAAPFVAALLIKIDRQLPHMSDLRQFLVEHPALVWVLGFPLTSSEQFRWGFDVEASLPRHQHFTRLLQQLPNSALQFLLSDTLRLIQNELPASLNFGDEISLDTKHIIAWVRENNPKEFIHGGRFHKEKQPKGDKDCRLGFKAFGNQSKQKNDDLTSVEPPTPTTNGKPASHARPGEYLWGYASGVVACKVPEWGEFVLAELTQSFDHSEVSYFFPLMQMTEARLGKRPHFAALDAAFDAFYVYAHFHFTTPEQAGFAAVPLRNQDEVRRFDPDGLPLCDAGFSMPLKSTYTDRSHLIEHQRGRYVCPLLFPTKSGELCPIAHKNWFQEGKNQGCLATLPTSIGTRLRVQLDRSGEQFQRIYKQRSATERVNSQAVELGIERPKLRSHLSIANQNTLIYIIINLRALDRVLLHKRQPPTPTDA